MIGIENVHEFYTTHYLAAILGRRFAQWQEEGPPLVVEVPRGDHLLTPLTARRAAMAAIEDWTATLP